MNNVDALIQQLAQRIGQLEVELTWLRLQLAQAQAEKPPAQETSAEEAK